MKKVINFNSERETEAKVIELTINGVPFIITGRRQIVIK